MVGVAESKEEAEPEAVGVVESKEKAELEAVGVVESEEKAEPEMVAVAESKGKAEPEMVAVAESKQKAEPEITFFTPEGAVSVPLDLVQLRLSRSCETRNYFVFSRTAFNTKTLMLHQLGYWEWEAAEPLEPVGAKKPAMLEGHHLRLWDLILSLTFPKSGCYLVDPISVLHVIFDSDSASAEQREYYLEGIRNALQRPHVFKLFFPLHCPEMTEHPEGHWTLLVLEKDEQSTLPLVRYYETMDEVNEICFSKAVKMLDMLKFSDSAQNLKRHNEARQTGAECTEQVAYYMELEYRHQQREGWGTIKCFRAHRPTIRLQLGRFAKHLETHRQAWIQKEQEDELKQKILQNQLAKLTGSALRHQVECDKLRKVAQAVAELNLQDHLGLPDLALPEPKPKAIPKPKPKPEPKPKAKPKPEPPELAEPGAVQPGAVEPGASEPEAAEDSKVLEPEALEAPATGEPKAAEESEPAEEGAVEPGAVEAKAIEPGAVQPGAVEPGAVEPGAVEPGAVEADADPHDPETEAKLLELQAIEGKIDKWLKTVSVEQKHKVLQKLHEGTQKWHEMKGYPEYVKMTETFNVCAKCRMQSGCEKCCHEKSLNYLLRHGHVPPWYKMYYQRSSGVGQCGLSLSEFS